MTVNFLVRIFLKIFTLPRAFWRWGRKGMAWPWVLILTGLAGGLIAALAKFIEKMNVPPGSP